MANEPVVNPDPKKIWQNQKQEGIRMSVEQLRSKAGKHRRTISWRNGREYVAALAVIVFFGFEFWRRTDVLTRVGFGVMIAGLLYVVWHLHSKGSVTRLPENLGLASSVDFHRRELERQRDLLRSIWSWYLGPMIPGLLILMVAMGRTNPGHLKHFGWVIGVYGAVVALAFFFVWRLNERAARRLQQRIDELDELSSDEECV
jgi:hypothetical protein